jgi:predicted metal-dependent hydrolase
MVRAPGETLREAQRLLDAGMPFHAHEVFEDAWKSGPEEDRELWRAMAQLAVGLTHAARGNAVGGARLLRRGAGVLDACRTREPYGIGIDGLVDWARELAARVERRGTAEAGPASSADPADPADPVRAAGGGLDAAAEAPRLCPPRP